MYTREMKEEQNASLKVSMDIVILVTKVADFSTTRDSKRAFDGSCLSKKRNSILLTTIQHCCQSKTGQTRISESRLKANILLATKLISLIFVYQRISFGNSKPAHAISLLLLTLSISKVESFV